MMQIRLETGEEAEAQAVDGSVLTLHSPRAFAPGSPIRFVARLEHEERHFEGRTVGSKRIDERRFEVRMRFVSLRRADREALVSCLDHE
ncbi:MAG: hypothetical protein AMJ62_04755 [Myxococcales bacterium SG8_38]|nr:MAG: hypothetical protein AMJ62_04755 [Myxococcales bacterium SG8_38]